MGTTPAPSPESITADPSGESRAELIARFNGYASGVELPAQLKQEIERREATLAPSYNLFYARPIEVASSEGAHLYASDGTRYLDMYNNIPSVGHANPRVAKAVYDQMLVLNTHTRYLYPPLTDFGERLLSTMPAAIDRMFLTNSGSEANDLAVRIARSATSATGVIVTDAAYHGNAGFADGISPISRVVSDLPDPAWLRTVPAPDFYRDGDRATQRFVDDVAAAIEDLRRSGHGFAAFFADMILSTDGVIAEPAGFFAPVADLVRAEGGLFVADEVQAGFGRLGASMWGFERHGLVPDLVTMGKPMGNGYPVAALVGRHDVLAAFGERASYFNTFAGSPAAVAAATAVLDEIDDRGLIERSRVLGARLLEGLRSLREEDPAIGDIRGSGLFVAVEYVTDQQTKQPHPLRALEVVARHREAGILISNTGATNNSLKIRPPLVIEEEDIDHFLDVFAQISRDHR